MRQRGQNFFNSIRSASWRRFRPAAASNNRGSAPRTSMVTASTGSPWANRSTPAAKPAQGEESTRASSPTTPAPRKQDTALAKCGEGAARRVARAHRRERLDQVARRQTVRAGTQREPLAAVVALRRRPGAVAGPHDGRSVRHRRHDFAVRRRLDRRPILRDPAHPRRAARARRGDPLLGLDAHGLRVAVPGADRVLARMRRSAQPCRSGGNVRPRGCGHGPPVAR